MPPGASMTITTGLDAVAVYLQEYWAYLLVYYCAWGLFCWHFLSRLGYKGKARGIWLFVVILSPATMFILFCCPWPCNRELRRLRRFVSELQVATLDDVERRYLQKWHKEKKTKAEIEKELRQLRQKVQK